VEHKLHVEFSANREGVVLDSLLLACGQNRLAAHAKVTDFANPKIDGSYEGVLVTREIAELLNKRKTN